MNQFLNPISAGQKKLAQLLKISLPNGSAALADALIDNKIDSVKSGLPPKAATQKMLSYAKYLGLDLINTSFRVVGAQISDHFLASNRQALKNLALKPGDKVITKKFFGDIVIVSSIRETDAMVYLKGIGCRMCHAGLIVKKL